MNSFRDVEDRLEQLRIPGVDAFYARMSPDPWEACSDDLRDALEIGDPTSTEHAIVSYEHRKRRLLSIYRDLLDILNKTPVDHDRTRSYMRRSVTLARDSVICDHCKCGVAERKSIRLTQGYECDALGDPIRVVHAACDKCERKETHRVA